MTARKSRFSPASLHRSAGPIVARLAVVVLSMAFIGCGPDQPGGQTDRGTGTGRATASGSAPVTPRQIDFFSYENNGTLPPPQAIAVSIRMSSNGHGVVHVTRAYSQTDSLVFAVDTMRVRRLYDSIRVRLVPAEEEDSGRGSQETDNVGGPVHSFSVTVEGVEYRVASGEPPSLTPLLPQPWPGFPPLPNGS